jgi:hypothetical protein
MRRIAVASFMGLTVLVAVAAVLDPGVLVDRRLEVRSHRDVQANRIVNTGVMRCRYLHLSGLAVRELVADDAHAVCARVASSRTATR